MNRDVIFVNMVLCPREHVSIIRTSSNRASRAIALTYNPCTNRLRILTGELETFSAPMPTFPATPLGIIRDFTDIHIIDHGQTLRFGQYEAAVEAVLLEATKCPNTKPC
jgi:hypothetical protein